MKRSELRECMKRLGEELGFRWVKKTKRFVGICRGIMVELVEAGLNLSAMAQELTSRGIQTRRGGTWTAKAVSNLLGRLNMAPAAVTV